MQESIQKMTEYMTIVKNIQHSFQAVIFFHVEVGEMDEWCRLMQLADGGVEELGLMHFICYRFELS